MKQAFDLIGDIHGQYDKLVGIFKLLGYEPQGRYGFRHHQRRRVIFLGDYIDRGPKSRDVLRTIRAMVDAGDALAIMGNHEYNAVCYHTPDGAGGWLRPRHFDLNSGIQTTLAEFRDREEEWAKWLNWMRHLPMFLDLGGLRAVHACWDARMIDRLKGRTLEDDAFLRASARHRSPDYHAVDHLLKGPELAMPAGSIYHDKEGHVWEKVRVRWWDIPERSRVSELVLPLPFALPGDATPQDLQLLPRYGDDEPPVFFGHYWLPANHPKKELRHNIACLDFSAGREGPLVAYRWNGESRLDAANFVAAEVGKTDVIRRTCGRTPTRL